MVGQWLRGCGEEREDLVEGTSSLSLGVQGSKRSLLEARGLSMTLLFFLKKSLFPLQSIVVSLPSQLKVCQKPGLNLLIQY